MAEVSYRLVVRTGPNPGMAFDLTKEVTLLGRDVTNDISLGDAEVSRQHARLTRTPGGIVVEDLGSTNGTFINGERLVAPRVMAMGDLLGFGETVTLDAHERIALRVGDAGGLTLSVNGGAPQTVGADGEVRALTLGR